MLEKLLSIGKTAKLLGVAIITLRRWEKKGLIHSFRSGSTGKRYFREDEIQKLLKQKDMKINNIESVGAAWVNAESPKPLADEYYCETSDTFQARVQRMNNELRKHIPEASAFFLTAIAGEIGNNSFNHNLGNWPDIPGVFFAYDVAAKMIVIGDRGRGLLATLKVVKPSLKNDESALLTAFTEYISGRAPENRGNGLKFVKKIIQQENFTLHFYSGFASLTLEAPAHEIAIRKSEIRYGGSLAIIKF